MGYFFYIEVYDLLYILEINLILHLDLYFAFNFVYGIRECFNFICGKASGCDGIPVELFQILKDDAVKVLHSICQANLENSAVATGMEKFSFHPHPKERQCQKLFKLQHNYIHLISW